jgi:ferric-dicitrate binding protein FerR (iron transport regulator)
MLNNRLIESKITSYLAGECTPAEQQVISGLIQSDAEYRDVYHELKQIWDIPAFKPVTESYNVDAAWMNVNRYISENPLSIVHRQQTRKTVVMRVMKYVAGIAAVLLVAFSVYQITSGNKVVMKQLASGSAVTSRLALSDGSHIVLNTGSEVKYPEKFGSDRREF